MVAQIIITVMTLRRKILKWIYPLLRKAAEKGNNGLVLENKKNSTPPTSFYSLTMTDNKGQTIPISAYTGKYILLVNTASDCGYTPQYADLQKLYEQYADKLIVLGFPANDFKEQERGTDDEIASFCQINYGVTFPLAQKSVVMPGSIQNPVFKWLTTPALNGWNNQPPVWNFSKYLVNPEGILTHYFGPAVAPKDIGPYLKA